MPGTKPARERVRDAGVDRLLKSVFRPKIGTTYYVDATSGNDSNNGKSTALAWQTVGKVNGETLLPGDNIRFKCGETWDEWLEMFADYLSPASLTFDAYGSGIAPIILGVEDIVDFAVWMFNTTKYNGIPRYVGTLSAGAADGTSWDNQWASGAVGWAAIQTLLTGGSNVYLFLDQGTYTSEWDVQASGTSDAVRLYILPGYAAEQLEVPGVHTGHIGQVIFDLAAANANGIDLNGQNYVTIDGYGDPRLSAGSNSKLIIKDINNDARALISGWNTTNITVRNVEIYQEINTNAGDGIKFNKAAPAVTGNHVIEYCYIHDGGYWTGVTYYAATWIDYYNDATIRYNEMRDWGNGNARAGEGVGFFVAHQTGERVYYNLFVNVGTAVRCAGLIRHNTFINNYICVFINNTMSQDAYIENNIFYDPADDAISATGVDMLYINSNVFSSLGSGAGWIHGAWYANAAALNAESDANITIQDANIDDDTVYFVNVPTDCHLRATASNLIDSAHEANWAGSKDFDRLKLPHAGAVRDIGCYEYVA